MPGGMKTPPETGGPGAANRREIFINHNAKGRYDRRTTGESWGWEKMKQPVKLSLGDQVRLKKPHPCGGTDWEIMRVGMDFRLKCLTCGRIMLIPRFKL